MKRRRDSRDQREDSFQGSADQTDHRAEQAADESPPDNEAGDVLYCTITLMLFDGFASSGCRSGEILELSARAGTALTHKTRHSAMLRFDKVRMAA